MHSLIDPWSFFSQTFQSVNLHVAVSLTQERTQPVAEKCELHDYTLMHDIDGSYQYKQYTLQ